MDWSAVTLMSQEALGKRGVYKTGVLFGLPFMDKVVSSRNADAVDDFMAADYVEHNPPPGVEPGATGLKQMMGIFISAFPDLTTTVEQLVAERDKVVGVMTTTGTHRGEFMGIPASGNKVSFTEFHVVRIVNGKAVEQWGLSDDMAMMQQVGAIPTP